MQKSFSVKKDNKTGQETMRYLNCKSACYYGLRTGAKQSRCVRAAGLTPGGWKSRVLPRAGGYSSMVESKLVELVVAGSNPVGHPTSSRPTCKRFRYRTDLWLEIELEPAEDDVLGARRSG